MARNPEADALKAFLILAVVFVHLCAAIPLEQNASYIRTPLSVLISYYFMPLFMAIAGYFFRYTVDKAPLHSLVINKFTELIIPILRFIWLRLSIIPPNPIFFSRQKHVSHLYPSILYC